MYVVETRNEQIQGFQTMVKNQNTQASTQENVAAAVGVGKRDGRKIDLVQRRDTPAPRSYVVTKLRDKSAARELKKQLRGYLTSVDKAKKSVSEWDGRIAEIKEEMNEMDLKEN